MMRLSRVECLALLLGVLVSSWSVPATGDARRIQWTEFLAPVERICFVEVTAAAVRPESAAQPVNPRDDFGGLDVLRTEMTATVRTEQSLMGACPSTMEVRWQVVLGFPFLELPLGEVGSGFLLFLGEELDVPGEIPTFDVSPRYAWQRKIGLLETVTSIAHYEPQHVVVPERLFTSQLFRFDFPNGHVAYTTTILEEATVLDFLRNLDGSPAPIRFLGAEEDSSFCTEQHHARWWHDCAYAILKAHGDEQRAKAAPSEDPWGAIRRVGRWAPDDRLAERLVLWCEELRAAAEGEGRTLLDGSSVSSLHDFSRCPCDLSEHEAYAEACVAGMKAIVPAMRRWEVNERLRLDGGLHVGDRFVHPACPLLKLDVEFVFERGGEIHPDDLVRTVGESYLEYPLSY